MLYDDKRWKNPAVKPIEEWQRVLFQAADLIDHCGHCKHAFTRDGKFCIEGAVFLTSKDHLTIALALEKLQSFVGEYVAVWNDKHERTPAEVIAALRGAATQ